MMTLNCLFVADQYFQIRINIRLKNRKCTEKKNSIKIIGDDTSCTYFLTLAFGNKFPVIFL